MVMKPKRSTTTHKRQIFKVSDGTKVFFFSKKKDAKVFRNQLNGETPKFFHPIVQVRRGPDHWLGETR